MNELQLIESKELRNKVSNRIEVLDQVKEIVTFANTDYSTVELAASFYDVGLEAIKSTIKRNKEELETDGLRIYKYKEIAETVANAKKVQVEPFKMPPRGLTLIPKRALLRIGMLLRDSEVAKEVRSLLLDNHEQLKNINEDLKEGKEIDIDKTNPTYFIDKEKELQERKQKIQDEIYICEKERNIKQARRLLLDLEDITDEILELEKEKSAIYRVGAEKWNKYLNNEGLTTIDSFSKALGHKDLGRNNMYKFLKKLKYLQGSNKPYQIHVNSKLFTEKVSGSYEDAFGNTIDTYKTFMTSKGVEKIIDKIEEIGNVKEFLKVA